MIYNYETLEEEIVPIDSEQKSLQVLGDFYSSSYKEPNRLKTLSLLQADEQYISCLPDLQNGPSSLIQGSPVIIQQVGIHNFRLPLLWKTKTGAAIHLETSVTGTVSLEAHKKGINMSRIMRSFYEFKDKTFSIEQLGSILSFYKQKLNSFEADLQLKISYPIQQTSLRSNLVGYQYYDITLEVNLNADNKLTKRIHFDYVYSSTCPCSFELSQHAIKYRNVAASAHSQRSVARVTVEFEDFIYFEELQELCLRALSTETQVIVKREDEQAFAELNAGNLKFVEDAVRLLYEQLNADPRITDFKVIASHQESLHSHDAIAVIIKNVPGGLTSSISRADLNTLIHIPR